MRRFEHNLDVALPTEPVKPRVPAADRKPAASRFLARGFPIRKVPAMARPVVRGPENARQGRQEGVVRHILVISTALVVILFVVAYIFVV
jgi:hypothetical protein